MKNPNKLLKKIRTGVNRNLRDIINNQQDTIVPPVPKKYLPANSYLRGLYNQIYYDHYAGLGDSSLSLSCVCLERMSRDLYAKFIGSDENIKWNQILEQLTKYFKTTYTGDEDFKAAMLEFLSNCMIIKDDIRNLLLHGKIDAFIEHTSFKHNAINILTGEKEIIEMGYSKAIHGKNKGRIKEEKIAIATQKILVFISMAIIRFNKYLDLSKF